MAANSLAADGLSLLLFLGAVVWTLCGDRIRVGGRLRKDQVWVDLTGVSSEFDAQLRTALGLPQYGHPSLPKVGGGLAPTSSPVAPMSAPNILPGG